MRQAVVTAVRSGLRDSQFRAGFDLITGAGLNAVAGLAFWFVAARTFDESLVGTNAALIATMASVVNIASLGMKNGLIRFMSSFGTRAALLVKRTYTITGLCTLVGTPIVAILLARHVDELQDLGTAMGTLVFTLACLIWIIFVLQDSVLIALSKTSVIPIANFAHAIAKLAVLVALIASAPKWGIFAAWTLPAIPIVVWVNVIAFRALRTFEGTTVAAPSSGLVRFAAGDHASIVLNNLLFGWLPIFVLAELGERASAFYALAWTIAYNLMLVNSQVGTAMLAAAAQDLDRLPQQTAKAMKQMAFFVVPGAAAAVIFARFGLQLFGESYAEEGTTLLRLFAVAGIANIAVSGSIGILRARRQVARLFGLYAVRSVLLVGLCIFFARRFDLTGIGWAWVIGESVLALFLLTTHIRPVLTGRTVAPSL